jgi:hypothetical protein
MLAMVRILQNYMQFALLNRKYCRFLLATLLFYQSVNQKRMWNNGHYCRVHVINGG